MTPLTPSQLSALEPLLREYVEASKDMYRQGNTVASFARYREARSSMNEALGVGFSDRVPGEAVEVMLHLIEENRRLREAGK